MSKRRPRRKRRSWRERIKLEAHCSTAPSFPLLRKGKVRSEAERIGKSLGYKICTPPAIETMCGTRARSEEDLCIACKIFGTASMRGGVSRASKVKFRDAYSTSTIEASLTTFLLGIKNVESTS